MRLKNIEVSRKQVEVGVRIALFLLAAIPAIYVFVAIQYSAITVPFWDHVELIKWISSWYDGTFTISSLWAPHNQTRPFVYRSVMLANAILTGWDIRSEYIYMYVAIFGVFLVHFRAIQKLTDTTTAPLIFPVSSLLISLLIFSPAGHNNHWWSMMFQLNIANLLIAIGLFTVFFNPNHWISHLLGLICCWLAAYSLTNGIFAFMTVIVILQLASNSFRPNGWALLWAFNLVFLLILYMPGIPTSTSSTTPSLGQLVWFSLVYLGAPLGSILWFPFKSQFDLPISTIFNGMCGVALIISAGLLGWHAKERLRKHHPAALILVGFVLFAGISALTTAWGRATFDASGISNANASRYTIFGVYLLFGQIYYVATGFAEGWWNVISKRVRQWKWQLAAVAFGVVTFVVLSGITYVRAIGVYADAHRTNLMLASAYQCGLKPTNVDQFIHPIPDTVIRLKMELQRLNLGPYRNSSICKEKTFSYEYKRPFPLYGHEILTQHFRVSAAKFNKIGVIMVTYGNSQTSYEVTWKLYGFNGNERSLVTVGTFDSMEVSDWQTIWLQFPPVSDSKGRIYEIEFSAPEKLDGQNVVGLPLYNMDYSHGILAPAISMGNSELSENLMLSLSLGYKK